LTRVLFVLSAADHWTLNDDTTHPTGYWAEEFAEPHRLFSEAGWEISIATPGGVAPTIDAASLRPDSFGLKDKSVAILDYIGSVSDELDEPRAVESVNVEEFDVVFYPGGHGPMEDLAVDEASGALLTKALESGRILGVLCHAPAALLAATDKDGRWPFVGYRMTGFTDAEEALGGMAPKAKWLLQSRLVELGADFIEGAPFTPHVEVDRTVYTGQNPASSVMLAERILAAVNGADSGAATSDAHN
jgi:aldehyde dehydrogenase (NAD+)